MYFAFVMPKAIIGQPPPPPPFNLGRSFSICVVEAPYLSATFFPRLLKIFCRSLDRVTMTPASITRRSNNRRKFVQVAIEERVLVVPFDLKADLATKAINLVRRRSALLLIDLDSGLELPLPPAPSRLVVDGQQRLTSLYAVFRGRKVFDDDYKERQIEIAFRPRDGKFEVADAATRRDPEWIWMAISTC